MSEASLAYNKNKFHASEILPDAPEGEWTASAIRGKSKISPTKSGDPMVTFQLRLDIAETDGNETFQGTQLPLRFVFFGDDNSKARFASRRTKIALRDISEQTGVSLDIIPDELNNPESDLQPFVDAVEGKQLTVWTVHRENKDTHEIMVDVNLRKPGSFAGAVSAREAD